MREAFHDGGVNRRTGTVASCEVRPALMGGRASRTATIGHLHQWRQVEFAVRWRYSKATNEEKTAFMVISLHSLHGASPSKLSRTHAPLGGC